MIKGVAGAIYIEATMRRIELPKECEDSICEALSASYRDMPYKPSTTGSAGVAHTLCWRQQEDRTIHKDGGTIGTAGTAGQAPHVIHT
jgi:hypothetical protein